jgi:hypothetical protein
MSGSRFGVILCSAILLPVAVNAEGMHTASTQGGDQRWNHKTEQRRHALWGAKAEMGEWYRVPMPTDPRDRMQAIHSVLLPSGKVLMVSGSSFRLLKQGCILKEGINGAVPAFVDQTALFDPEKVSFLPLATSDAKDDPELVTARNSFQRIDSPRTPIEDEPNDLFCAGHMHTPDGNVLFVSGTRKNEFMLQFPGHLCASIFDWKTEKWLPSTKSLRDGHWYPAMIALPDGRIAAISGFKHDFEGKPPANSRWIEIYDHRAKTWAGVDISSSADGPFSSKFRYAAARPDPADPTKPVYDAEGRPVLQVEEQTDELDHYPRVMSLPDGRFLISGDGSGCGNPLCHFTYLMKIDVTVPDKPTITFEKGPLRPDDRRIYGTALIDPNSPRQDVLFIGGMRNGPNVESMARHPVARNKDGTFRLEGRSAMLGPFRDPLPEEKKDFVTTSMYRFRAPVGPGDPGGWETTQNFLGDRVEDARVQCIAVILPTKQFLVMGGGNYFFDRPVFSPRMYTPDSGAPGGYTSAQMNPCTQPRLYHSVALLLPDGRIFTASGNAARAVMDPNAHGPGHDLSYNFVKRHSTDNTYAFVDSGEYRIPAENHQIELFAPPYLFLEGARPKFLVECERIYGGPGGTEITLKVEHATPGASLVLIKLGSVTHAWDMGQRLVDLAPTFKQDSAVATEQGSTTATISFGIPADRNLCPPGYYMLFYVNSRGQPVEKAVMIKVE